tara:strand:- start:247 stop:495 length:249 start_codon:yes stop_codon:yes gene_type:complete
MEKGYITILDFEIGSVFQYEVADMNMQCEACEQFIEDKGHNITNCEWMKHKNNTIKFDYPKEVVEDLRRIDINMDGTREICG